jgi:hypothetical protein
LIPDGHTNVILAVLVEHTIGEILAKRVWMRDVE